MLDRMIGVEVSPKEALVTVQNDFTAELIQWMEESRLEVEE